MSEVTQESVNIKALEAAYISIRYNWPTTQRFAGYQTDNAGYRYAKVKTEEC